MIDENLDVLIGSRFINKLGFQSSVMRRMGIKYFMLLNKWLTGYIITDNTSGLRMLNKKAIKIANSYYPDEYPEPESFILFTHSNCTVGEIAVEMRRKTRRRIKYYRIKQYLLYGKGYFSYYFYTFKIKKIIWHVFKLYPFLFYLAFTLMYQKNIKGTMCK